MKKRNVCNFHKKRHENQQKKITINLHYTNIHAKTSEKIIFKLLNVEH